MLVCFYTGKLYIMRLYHYILKGSNVLQTGLFSFSKSPNADLNYYIKRSGYKTQHDISQWMENFFTGYSRGIRVLKEPLKWHPRALRLKEIIDSCDLLEIDVDTLQKDGLIEAVYYHPPLSVDDTERAEQLIKQENLHNDGFYPIRLADILPDPVDYSVCDDTLGRRFAFLPFYLLVMKDGVIQPQYLRIIPQPDNQ